MEWLLYYPLIGLIIMIVAEADQVSFTNEWSTWLEWVLCILFWPLAVITFAGGLVLIAFFNRKPNHVKKRP